MVQLCKHIFFPAENHRRVRLYAVACAGGAATKNTVIPALAEETCVMRAKPALQRTAAAGGCLPGTSTSCAGRMHGTWRDA